MKKSSAARKTPVRKKSTRKVAPKKAVRKTVRKVAPKKTPTPGTMKMGTPDEIKMGTPEPTPEANPEPTPEANPEPTQEATPETIQIPEATPEAAPEPTPEPTPEVTPEATPEKPSLTAENSGTEAAPVGASTNGDIGQVNLVNSPMFTGDTPLSQTEPAVKTETGLLSKAEFFELFITLIGAPNMAFVMMNKPFYKSLDIQPDDLSARGASDALYAIILDTPSLRAYLKKGNERLFQYIALGMFGFNLSKAVLAEYRMNNAKVVNPEKEKAPTPQPTPETAPASTEIMGLGVEVPE